MSTDYSKMSDFEINCEVAKYNNWTSKSFVHEIHSGKWNPCNNPADAWPIIVENKLWLRELYGTWQVRGFPTHNPNDIITQSDTNPLRSAMIVFLKMQEYKNAS